MIIYINKALSEYSKISIPTVTPRDKDFFSARTVYDLKTGKYVYYHDHFDPNFWIQLKIYNSDKYKNLLFSDDKETRLLGLEIIKQDFKI